MNDLTEFDAITGEVYPPATGLYAAVAAQLDKTISTARAFPRTMARVGSTLSTILSDEKTAESCIYSLKRGGRTIQGPSSRFAELVAYAYGHLRVDARLVEEGKDYIVVRGEAHDLQTNTSFAQDVTRRIVDSRGKRYDVDLISVTFMAAASIAQRDCILKTVPSHLWRPAFEAALQRITGDVKTLADRRVKAIGQFSVIGVTAEQVFRRLGVANINEVTADHMVDLVGTFQAIKAGDTTVEAEFGDTRITSKSLGGSPLAAQEDNGSVQVEGDAGNAAAVPDAAPPVDVAPIQLEVSQPKEAPAKPQPKESVRPVAPAPVVSPPSPPTPDPRYLKKDKDLDSYERECVAAKTSEELTTVAFRWGASGLVDDLTPAQKARFDDVFDASMRALKLQGEAQEAAQAKKAYAAAKSGQDGDSRPAAPTPPQPQKAAVEAPAGAGEHIFYSKLDDVRPTNPEVLAIWKECVDYLLGAKNAGDVIARYNTLEQKGKVAAIEKLSEQDALQLRTVRLRIKQSKAAQ